MESDYVRRCVGQALALGLAEVGAVRPADPVEYLALWLLQHKRNLDEKDKVSEALAESRLKHKPKPVETTEENKDEKKEEGTEKEVEDSVDTVGSRDTEEPGANDTTEATVTPPLSSSAQGRPNSKLSSIMEAEEQEKNG